MDYRTLKSGHARAKQFHQEFGPLAVAMNATLIPKIFTDEQEADHKILYVNDAFLKLTGFTRAETLGAPFRKMLSGVADSKPPKPIQQVMATGGFGIWKIQCRRDSKREILAAVEVHPVRDRNNILCQNFISFVELGDHVARAVELNRHLDQPLNKRDPMATLYDSAPGFIAVTTGPDHRFI